MGAEPPNAKEPTRRGRPSLGVKPTLVRLPDGVPERIDAVAGKNRRAEFIREATVTELERREAAVTVKSRGDFAPPTE